MAKRDPFTKETRKRATSCLKSEKMENWEILHQLKRLFNKFAKPCSWGNGPHCIFNEPISLGRSLHLRIPEEVHLAVCSTVDCAVTSTYNRCNFIANPKVDKRTGSAYVYQNIAKRLNLEIEPQKQIWCYIRNLLLCILHFSDLTLYNNFFFGHFSHLTHVGSSICST